MKKSPKRRWRIVPKDELDGGPIDKQKANEAKKNRKLARKQKSK